jgi:hypothetical protein
MAIYNLRNGLTIDLTFPAPTRNSARPAIPKYSKGDLYGSFLDASPNPIDAFNNPIPSLSVIKMRAEGKVLGGSKELLDKCSLRFIQFIKVRQFKVAYAGKRPDQGGVSWEWSGQLLLHNVDCLGKKRNSFPFQFDSTQTERHSPNRLVAKLDDGPHAQIPLAELNRKSKCDNYLWMFSDCRKFESIVTFVHADGSLEMLESWKWGIERLVELKWVRLGPEPKRNIFNLNADPSSTAVFGKDASFADALKAGRIANDLTDEAMKNVRSSSDINYVDEKESRVSPDEGSFWAP